MTLLAAGIALYGVYQFLSGTDRIWHFVKPLEYAGRASGTYICPNHYAGFLEMVLPLTLAYVVAGRMGSRWRLLFGAATLFI